MNKLKIGDKIIENDGIAVIIYKVVEIRGNKAFATTEFEGKTYHNIYRTRYSNPDNIHKFFPVLGDSTRRSLAR